MSLLTPIFFKVTWGWGDRDDRMGQSQRMGKPLRDEEYKRALDNFCNTAAALVGRGR